MCLFDEEIENNNETQNSSFRVHSSPTWSLGHLHRHLRRRRRRRQPGSHQYPPRLT